MTCFHLYCIHHEAEGPSLSLYDGDAYSRVHLHDEGVIGHGTSGNAWTVFLTAHELCRGLVLVSERENGVPMSIGWDLRK